MVSTRARKAENVEFKSNGDGTTIVKFGQAPVGQITERPDGEFDYTAFDERTLDGHFVTYEDTESYVRVALGSIDTGNGSGPGPIPDIIKEAQSGKRRRSPKVLDPAAEREKKRLAADKQKERERKTKERQKAAEAKKKEREKLLAQRKAEREAAAEAKKVEREATKEARRAEREAAKIVNVEGLVPGKMRGRSKLASVPITEIDELDVGVPVDRDLVESVRVHGIIEPPIVRQTASGRYVPIAGRRRIQAARANGIESVEAILESRAGSLVSDEITLLVENIARSPNVIAQYKAIQRLIDDGHTTKQIAAAVPMEKREVDKLLRLGRLHPRLLDAAEDGLMSPWSADQIARKEMGEQDAFVRILEEARRITTEDVKGSKKVKQGKAAGELADRFADADGLDEPGGQSVSRDTIPSDDTERRAFALDRLRLAYSALVASGSAMVDALEGMIEQLEVELNEA